MPEGFMKALWSLLQHYLKYVVNKQLEEAWGAGDYVTICLSVLVIVTIIAYQGEYVSIFVMIFIVFILVIFIIWRRYNRSSSEESLSGTTSGQETPVNLAEPEPQPQENNSQNEEVEDTPQPRSTGNQGFSISNSNVSQAAINSSNTNFTGAESRISGDTKKKNQ